MLSKNLLRNYQQNSSFLHSNLVKLRQLANNNFAPLQSFSTVKSSKTAQKSPQTDKILFEDHFPSLTEIKINAPKSLNSIDLDMVNSMIAKVKEWNKNPQTAPRVVLMSGVGDKAFCAGGDIKNLYDASIGKVDPQVKAEFFAREYLLDYALSQMKPLQISLWNGIVMGGGVGISVHAPLRIATEQSVYAMPETGIGFFTDVGGSYFLSRVHHNIHYGLYLAITGHRLKGRDLVKFGVATHFVPHENINQLKDSLIKNSNVQITDDEIIRIIDSMSDKQAENEPVEYVEEIDQIFLDDSIQNIFERLEKSKSEFAKKTLKETSHLSPLSMAIAFEQIKRGKDLDLKQVFEMEYKISQGLMNHREFFEGVRALLIDKDKKPKWSHKHVRDIKKEEVDYFFNRNDTLNLDISKA